MEELSILDFDGNDFKIVDGRISNEDIYNWNDTDNKYLNKTGDTISDSQHQTHLEADHIKVERLDYNNSVEITENGTIRATHGSYSDDTNRKTFEFDGEQISIKQGKSTDRFLPNIFIRINEIIKTAYDGLPFFRLFIDENNHGNLDIRKGDIRITDDYENGTHISMRSMHEDIEELKKGGGGGGTTVIANPDEEPTEIISKIKIGDTVYSIPQGGISGLPAKISIITGQLEDI